MSVLRGTRTDRSGQPSSRLVVSGTLDQSPSGQFDKFRSRRSRAQIIGSDSALYLIRQNVFPATGQPFPSAVREAFEIEIVGVVNALKRSGTLGSGGWHRRYVGGDSLAGISRI